MLFYTTIYRHHRHQALHPQPSSSSQNCMDASVTFHHSSASVPNTAPSQAMKLPSCLTCSLFVNKLVADDKSVWYRNQTEEETLGMETNECLKTALWCKAEKCLRPQQNEGWRALAPHPCFLLEEHFYSRCDKV
jgi:hypothetical protein